MPHVVEIGGNRFAVSHEHRGGLAVDPATLWPARDLVTRAGGSQVIELLIDDLYVRIERDPQLSRVFPNFQTNSIKPFFVTALGGGSPHASTSALGSFHRGIIVTPQLASRWLQNMKSALKASPIEPNVCEEILAWLRPLARGLVNTADEAVAGRPLVKLCSGIQTHEFAGHTDSLSAAARGRLPVVREAVGADPDVLSFRNVEGRSLLWEAVSRKRVALVEYLLQQGADVNLPGCDPAVINLACSGSARLGTAVMVTPWALATARGHSAIAKLLGADGALHDIFSAAYLGDLETLAAALEARPSLLHAEDPAEDFSRITPLHHAIAGGHAEATAWLIEQGARVEPHSHWLLTHAALQNRADLVELLLDNGADVHCAGVLGPLDNDDRPVADLIIARGFDINADSNYGAMLVRACRGDVSSSESSRVQTLLGYGADVNQDHHGLTALHYAARSGRPALIQLLLDHGADVHRRDNENLTPLAHLAKTRAKADPIPVMQLLVDHGADLNSQSGKGETILYFFARRGDRRAVEWLLDHGASPGVRNHAGKSVLDVIQRKTGGSVPAIQSLISRRLET